MNHLDNQIKLKQFPVKFDKEFSKKGFFPIRFCMILKNMMETKSHLRINISQL